MTMKKSDNPAKELAWAIADMMFRRGYKPDRYAERLALEVNDREEASWDRRDAAQEIEAKILAWWQGMYKPEATP